MSLITFKQFIEKRGSLGVIDDRDIPFKIKRVFWIKDVPSFGSRGHHSHKECEQVIVCLAGSFTVWLDALQYGLNETSKALYVSANTRIELDNFSADAICLVLASEYYDEDEVVE